MLIQHGKEDGMVPLVKWMIKEADITKSTRWFEAKGPAIIFASRFLPGSRLATYFSAGLLGVNSGKLLIYFFLAAFVWTPMLVGLAVIVGKHWFQNFAG